MSRAFFDDIADALPGFVTRELRAFHVRTSTRNVKVWYGDDAHEHYEAQFVSASILKRKQGGLEIGFHAEHPSREKNEIAVARLGAVVRRLRCEAGAFLGRPSPWMRISEVWDSDGITDDAAIEAAERLAAYIRTIEPRRRRG